MYDINQPYRPPENNGRLRFAPITSIFKSQKSKKVNKKSALQRTLIYMCAQWVARDCQPLSVVEDGGFRNILREFAPRLHEVSRDSVLTRLREAEKIH